MWDRDEPQMGRRMNHVRAETPWLATNQPLRAVQYSFNNNIRHNSFLFVHTHMGKRHTVDEYCAFFV